MSYLVSSLKSQYNQEGFSNSSSTSSNSSYSYFYSSPTQCTKSICRYSWGCTHKNDSLHQEKFWHPKIYFFEEKILKKNFICYECGFAAPTTAELQIHIKSKTAWSNIELVGSRICILIDSKEWHEAIVKDFRAKKHLICFKYCNEKRWLNLLSFNFYIVERPPLVENDEFCPNNQVTSTPPVFYSNKSVYATYPPIYSWNFCEEISHDYAFSQSTLYKIYGNSVQETGHLTQGHLCLSNTDEQHAKNNISSLLYGELLPRGLNKAMQKNRLNFNKCTVLFELGMGTGKIAIQSFLQYANISYVFGIELSKNRYEIAEIALLNLVFLLGKENFILERKEGEFIIAKEIKKNIDKEPQISRILHFQCGNLFSLKSLEIADIVMMETDIPKELYRNLYQLLHTMKEKSRLLSYIDLTTLYQERKEMSLNSSNNFNQCPINCSYYIFDFEHLNENKSLGDRYSTSWSVQRGHHFFLWKKLRSNIETKIEKNMQKVDQVKYNLGESKVGDEKDEELSLSFHPEYFYYHKRIKENQTDDPSILVEYQFKENFYTEGSLPTSGTKTIIHENEQFDETNSECSSNNNSSCIIS